MTTDGTENLWNLPAVMLRRDLFKEGWNDRRIAGMYDGGQWVKSRQGAYVDAQRWARLSREERHLVRARAVLMTSNVEVTLSHVSGVPLYGGPIWGLDLRDVHITRADQKAGRASAGVRQHRGVLLPDDVTTRYGFPVVSATRLGLEVTTVADTAPALAVVNHLLRWRFTTVDLLRERYEAMPHWPATLKTGLVLRLADARIDGVGETRVWHLVATRGLPLPEPQVVVRDAGGKVIGIVDFLWRDQGVFLEFDGKVKYLKHLRPGEGAQDVVVREKKREDRIRELTNWRCIRVDWGDLQKPDLLAQRIRHSLDLNRTANA